MANLATLKPFKKNDPRINKKGRPKTFSALRDLAQSIAHEEVKDGAGQPAVIDGHIVTKAELIMRTWAQSKDPRLQQAFIEVAYGKAAQQVEIAGKDGGPVVLAFSKWPGADGNG
jgi:hypothetical protein